jgi:DNA helicase II / ATP-dependent DNA helicase PcrA
MLGRPGSGGAGARSEAGALNPAQERAASTLNGPVLVIAGAGTGKTRTLVHRLVRLIDAGVAPESILLLTFTRRAAAEMIGRASALLPGRAQRVAGGTFHSFAHGTLRRLGRHVGLSSRFTVLDQADSFEVLSGIRTELKLGERGRGFPRRETIAAMISRAVNQQVPVAQVVETEYPQFAEETALLEEIASRYGTYKAERALVDFDDLLLYLIRLLHESERARHELRERYTHVMVDEYQDTNVLQAEITRLLAAGGGNVLVVGDDAQSIYAFRGARFTNLHDFKRVFQGTKLITLEQNYRSTQPILDAGNALLHQMSKAFRKRLFTKRTAGGRPLLVEADDETEQARFVAKEIARLRESGVAAGEIGVLFRASHHAIPLELLLARDKVRYAKYGGFRFLEAAHLKDVLAHLRVLANPGDDLSLARALSLCEGIGRAGAKRIARTAAGQSPLPDAIRQAAGSGKKRIAVEPLARLLERLATPARPVSLLLAVIEHYEPLMKLCYDDWPRRSRDLEQLVPICEPYESVESLLADLALEPPSAAVGQNLARAREADPETLVLSTVHSAKGLEWHAVFVIQALDGCIPMLPGFGDEEPDPEQLDEELRLLYVAVTRAKDRLYLVWPRATVRGYGYGWAPCSRFLEAMPPALLQQQRARDLLAGSGQGEGAGARQPHGSR